MMEQWPPNMKPQQPPRLDSSYLAAGKTKRDSQQNALHRDNKRLDQNTSNDPYPMNGSVVNKNHKQMDKKCLWNTYNQSVRVYANERGEQR